MELIEFLSQGWVGSLIGIVGLLIGIISIVIAYRVSRIGPRPVFQYRSINLIEKEKQALPSDVEIFFGGKKVSRLTKTYIIFWNSGKSTLYGKDIVDDNPLRFSFGKDAEILRARIPKITKKMNKFEARINPKSPNEVIINFDYLDPNDGAVIEILHTSIQRTPECKGTIRGVPNGILNWGRLPYNVFLTMLQKAFLSVLSLLCLFFLGIRIFFVGILDHESELVILGLLYLISASSLCLYLIPASPLCIYRRRYPKSLSIEDVEE